MSGTLLPSEFSDLETLAQTWVLPTEDERWERRLASSYDEIQNFYNAFEPRAEEAVAHIDRSSIDDMPEDTKNLLRLLYAFVQCSFPVECWGQVRVPDTGAAHVSCIVEPVV